MNLKLFQRFFIRYIFKYKLANDKLDAIDNFKCKFGNEIKLKLTDNDIFRYRKVLNKSMNQEYIWYDSEGNPHEEDMAGPIINSYKNGNIMSVCYSWMEAPSISELFEYVDANL
jgi:hypothetical protein